MAVSKEQEWKVFQSSRRRRFFFSVTAEAYETILKTNFEIVTMTISNIADLDIFQKLWEAKRFWETEVFLWTLLAFARDQKVSRSYTHTILQHQE